jgi:glycosyltransferase involved in cell wall biosynthesis
MPTAADHGFPNPGALSVIVVNDFAEVRGGTDRVALDEAAGLARRGHRVTLIAGAGDPAPSLLEAGVTVHVTGQRSTLEDSDRIRAAARGIWNRHAAALVDRVAAGAGPATIVHLHGFTKVLSASVARAAVRSGLPTVATVHDYFVACPNGGFFNYPREQICRLEPLSARCVATDCDSRAYSHKLWRVGRSAVQRRFGEIPGGVRDFIVPSRLARQIVGRFLPAGARCHIVPSPVEVPRSEPADPAASESFVFVGRLQRDKGAAVFARAARQAGVRAVFVGSGEESDAIRRACPDAELTGWLAPEQVRTVVRGARAAINPSLVYETQGLTLLEAAAEGIPGIVSDTSAAREAVADGVTGLWARAGDSDDLADKLIMLRREPELARRLGGSAYERFWSGGWDAARHLDRLEAVHRGALAA